MRVLSRQCLYLFLCISLCAAAPISNPPSPVTYQHIVRRGPNYSIHIVRVDLRDRHVAIHIARGGPDPDGDGPWLTTLLPTSEIAERDHFDVAINGDFFEAQATKDVEGRNTGYVRGKPAAPVGTAMTDGVLWHRSQTTRSYLEITSSNIAKIAEGGPADPIDASAREIVGGSQIIVRGGRAILFPGSKFAEARHPRTAVGIDASGTQLTLLVVDGRQPELSIGMTLAELSEEMIRAGCATAINLDGGGSTTLVYRDAKSKKLAVLNSPSDSKERAVADVLGVTLNTNVASVSSK
ncbi:MAG TPA: phosphodiester glycosidase family protein [Verrucomicrobiae bacterium]|nr:phosphodiester glycosidase family protein [Verrucomicrobiae bacterium]